MMTIWHNLTRSAYGVYLFPIIAVLAWSINIVVTRYAIDYIAPMSISFYRWLIAWLILSVFWLPKVIREWQSIRPLLGKLAVLGLFGMVCYQGFAYTAAQYTTATNMGIINAFIPVFSIVLSVVVLNIRPKALAIVGVILSILGLLYVMGQGNITRVLQGQHIVGDALMVLAVLLYACYGIFLQHWVLTLALPLMLYMQISFAVLFHLPLLMIFGLDTLNAQNLPSVLYAAIFPSILAPLVWMLSIQHLGSNRSSVFMNLLPLVTALIAYLFLHENWTIYHTVGSMMVLCGIFLAQRK